METELVTIAQAALEFSVARSTLYAHMKAGGLTRHTRKGGTPRVFLDRRELRRLFSPEPEKRKGRK
jgi:hypothetical protein